MNLHVIGLYRKGNKIIGFRLVDSDNGNLMSIANSIENIDAMRKNKISIHGLKLGKYGHACINNETSNKHSIFQNEGDKCEVNSPLIILYRIDDRFIVSDADGNIKNCTGSDLIGLCQRCGFVNGHMNGAEVIVDDIDLCNEQSMKDGSPYKILDKRHSNKGKVFKYDFDTVKMESIIREFDLLNLNVYTYRASNRINKLGFDPVLDNYTKTNEAIRLDSYKSIRWQIIKMVKYQGHIGFILEMNDKLKVVDIVDLIIIDREGDLTWGSIVHTCNRSQLKYECNIDNRIVSSMVSGHIKAVSGDIEVETLFEKVQIAKDYINSLIVHKYATQIKFEAKKLIINDEHYKVDCFGELRGSNVIHTGEFILPTYVTSIGKWSIRTDKYKKFVVGPQVREVANWFITYGGSQQIDIDEYYCLNKDFTIKAFKDKHYLFSVRKWVFTDIEMLMWFCNTVMCVSNNFAHNIIQNKVQSTLESEVVINCAEYSIDVADSICGILAKRVKRANSESLMNKYRQAFDIIRSVPFLEQLLHNKYNINI